MHLNARKEKYFITEMTWDCMRYWIFEFPLFRKQYRAASRSTPSISELTRSASLFGQSSDTFRGSREGTWGVWKHDQQWEDRPKWEMNQRSGHCSRFPGITKKLLFRRSKMLTFANLSSMTKYLSRVGIATSFRSCSLSEIIQMRYNALSVGLLPPSMRPMNTPSAGRISFE